MFVKIRDKGIAILQSVFSVKDFLKNIDISLVSVHDINYLNDIKSQKGDCLLIGEREYIFAKWETDLLNSCNIKLEKTKRRNQNNFWEQPGIFKKSRKRAGTLFLQLCEQLMAFRNYTKTFEGYRIGILSKSNRTNCIGAVQHHFIFKINLNKVKVNVI